MIIAHEKNVPVFKLERIGGQIEINFVGRLIGHLCFVNCGTLLEEQGIFVTVDETAVIKFWSLVSLTCLRTVNIEGKSIVKFILFSHHTRSLALISKKINLYKITQDPRETSCPTDDPVLYVAANSVLNALLIFRTTEVIFVDWATGLVT